MNKSFVALLSLVCSLSLRATASDWPQFRGPNRDDISTESGLLKKWPADGPPLAWKAAGIGSGYSTVSVVGDQVFTMGDKDGSSHVFALSAADGKLLWSTKVGKPGGNYDGTRCTPTFNDGHVYALGQFADLVCLNAADGKEVWRKNLESEFGGRMMSGWNFSESPLVDGKLLICTPGGTKGTLLALDKLTGATVWQCSEMRDAAAYSSVVAADIGGVHQYVQLTAKNVFAVDAATGKMLWSAPREGKTAVIPTPVIHDDMVYVTSGYNIGCNCFKITAKDGKFSAQELYNNKDMINHHGGVLRIGDYIYGYSEKGGWTCMEMKTGTVKWKNPGVGKGSITCADGMIYLRSQDGAGTIALIEASPEAYKELGQFNQPMRSKKNSWPHPVVSNGKLFIRDQDNLLVYNISAK